MGNLALVEDHRALGIEASETDDTSLSSSVPSDSHRCKPVSSSVLSGPHCRKAVSSSLLLLLSDSRKTVSMLRLRKMGGRKRAMKTYKDVLPVNLVRRLSPAAIAA